MLNRSLQTIVTNALNTTNKGVVIYGARQVGKTTLAFNVLKDLNYKTLSINADQSKYFDVLSSRDVDKLKNLVEGYDLLFIDEAQRIPEIGINLKIILDNFKNLKVIVTGSSSLDLASKISEPLTGRTLTYRLYPISFFELSSFLNKFELETQLDERMIYGSYPEIFSIVGDANKKEYLQNLCDAYLYKDLLELGNIRNSNKIRDLLKLLAFQIGSEVSLSEIGSSLGMGTDTVSRYIDYLEKSYVVFRLSGFSRNLRKEVTKMDKIFFYDLGVRNMLIDNLKPLKDRFDVGQLWENFLVVERMKYLAYTQKPTSAYFWRLHTGAELDYVEDSSNLNSIPKRRELKHQKAGVLLIPKHRLIALPKILILSLLLSCRFSLRIMIDIHIITELLNQAYPNPKTELVHKNGYELVVAVMLSAQTTDKKVNQVTPKLFENYPAWQSLAQAKLTDLWPLIHAVNFYKGKGERLIQAAKKLTESFHGNIPDILSQLVTIPGIARKSANVILNELFNKAEGVVVDTHVTRVSQRLGLTTKTDPVKIEQDLMKLFPKHSWRNLSQALVLHGRYICIARKPKCEECVLNNICPSRQ
jgi:endonuclease III